MNHKLILGTGFFFSQKKNRLIYCKNYTKQGTEDIQTFTSTQPKTLTTLTHNIPYKPHTQLSTQTKKCAYGDTIKVWQINKNINIRVLQDQ